MPYKVEMRFAYGWDDAGWLEDDVPMRFDLEDQAVGEIEDHCRLYREAFTGGDMSEPCYEEDFRVVRVDE